MAGEEGTSSVVRVIRSEVLVFKLSWLGFRFIAGIIGLINDGEDGSERTLVAVVAEAAKGG